MERQDLDSSSALYFVSEKARGEHSCVVGDEQVSGAEEASEIREAAVLDTALSSRDNEQATAISTLCRHLGHRLGLQNEGVGVDMIVGLGVEGVHRQSARRE
jgi:hypothetical protein